MTEFTYSGRTAKLSAVLARECPQINYNTLRKLLRKGDVRINGKKTFSDITIGDGDVVRVYYKVNSELKIIYENNDIAVFFKPVKIASVGENSFESAVKAQYPDYLPCHRLDTNTDGLIVFAKNSEAYEELFEAFKKRTVEKHYLTVVGTIVSEPKELIGYLIKKDDGVLVSDIFTEGSRQIITRYTPVAVNSGCSILDVELVTGRTHQIRAHLAHVGLPIIGDGKYGDSVLNKKFNKKYQILRAYKLIFHINSGKLAYLNELEVSLPAEEFINGLNM